MLLKTALRGMKKNFGMNLLTLLQMLVTLTVTAVMISSVVLRFRTYLPFADYFGGNAVFAYFDAGRGAYDGDWTQFESLIQSPEKLLSYTKGDSILTVHRLPLGYKDDYIDKSYSYDDGIIERYQPLLKEGRWLSTDPEQLEAVVSDNPYGWKVGDTVEFNATLADESVIPVRVKIVGILTEGGDVFGTQMRRGADELYYRQAFSPYSYEIEGEPLMLFSRSAVDKFVPEYSDVQVIVSSTLIGYPEDTDEEVLKEDCKKLINMGGNLCVTTKSMNETNMNYLFEQIYQLLPIVIVLMVLTIVSSISCSALTTRRSLKDYAKFYLLGLKWRQCALINLFQSLTIAVVSLALSLCAMAAIKLTPLSESFMVILEPPVLLSLAVPLLLYLLFSMIMPTVMLSRTTPKEILQEE